MNSAFVCSEDLCRSWRVLSTLAYNTLLDLNNNILQIIFSLIQ